MQFRLWTALLTSLILATNGRAMQKFVPIEFPSTKEMSREERLVLRSNVRDMFYHGYNNYMALAFPHDELKPLSGTYSDSFVELGNLDLRHLPKNYSGIGLTRIDALSTLAVLGDKQEFQKSVRWFSKNLSFDLDARVNVFEADIRVLGGLLSAHLLASDESLGLMDTYHNELLDLAYDLGKRLIPAFDTETGIPWAWINLSEGVLDTETIEQCTAGVGTLILEFEVLSRLTNDTRFANLAFKALETLWAQRSTIDLLGNTINIQSLKWNNQNSGIGAGMDSFYEHLYKTYIILGKYEYWKIFQSSYDAVLTHLKQGAWYVEANMHTGAATITEFQSLQAFWPGLQVIVGDIDAAKHTQSAFESIWRRYSILPERYLTSGHIHPTEKYNPLRPEFAESTFFLFRATKDPHYLLVGREIYNALNARARVDNGYANIKDVETFQLEDRMSSFFLAETCKYLYLLFDWENFYYRGNWVFNTEGHLFPVFPMSQDDERQWNTLQTENPLCEFNDTEEIRACHVEDKSPNHTCMSDADCGVDGHTCKKRYCSSHHYCATK